MKILRIIASLDPRTGGPVNGLLNSTEELARMGHQTEVVTLDDPSEPYLKQLSFPVAALGPGKRFARYKYAPIGNWIAANAMRFDCAIVHGLWNHASIGGGLALRRSKLPYVVFSHGMMDPWFKDRYPVKHMAKQILWSSFQGRVLSGAEKVLFTSQQEMKLSVPVFRGHNFKAHVVPYGTVEVPSRCQDIISQSTAFYEILPEVRGKKFILFLSRIHEKKGVDLLLNAFIHLKDVIPDYHLVIAGPDHQNLTGTYSNLADGSGVSDRVHWPGMLSGDAKLGAFREAKAFALISHQENFGIAVAEALACGTPVLISDKVNIWEEVLSSGAGFVGPNSLEGAVNLIRRLASTDTAELQKMHAAAISCFRLNFSMPSAAQGLLNSLAQTR